MKKRYPHKCKLCKHKWAAVIPHPKACPRCKRYDGVLEDKIQSRRKDPDPDPLEPLNQDSPMEESS